MISLDDIPAGDMRFIAEHLGIAVALGLMKLMGGEKLYVPKKCFHRLYIRQKFKGDNVKALARELGLSERTVQRYVKDLFITPKSLSQLEIFDNATKEAS
ncbi:hypothetical protein Ctha_0278 [Chloroherpeton thalassium ATCC 35110]|uniref:Mor transcription activator domain-containing protein n=1 Tax=Chloroherpeton thalassium (strain ATCC 35110 / GB-78) TaxID=517418 RepID=B3QTK3_CHLT3|nr:Mor transcription activator family protein [Chloroherpeton thalassium]ACF12749.1 hypothetical protein Ctha_0278 [Chloroherpeton thalassium ATCC 35110]